MRRLVPVLVLVALAVSCSRKPSPERVAGSAGSREYRVLGAAEQVAPPPPASPAGLAQADTAEAAGAPSRPAVQAPGQSEARGPEGQVAVPRERKLIRDAEAWLEVKSVDEALARLRRLAESAGGYVTSESRSRDEHGVGHGMFVCRVPAGKLEETTAALKAMGSVERFQVSASDITEEYFNLELRLRNERMLEGRLLALLGRPGNKLSDLLEAERELARVRGEIDQLEGRQRFWDNRVSLSTVTVNVHEPQPAVAGEQGGAFAAVKRSFSEAADNFVLAVAGIIAFTGGLVPVLLALGIVAWLFGRWRRWRRQRRAAKTTAA